MSHRHHGTTKSSFVNELKGLSREQALQKVLGRIHVRAAQSCKAANTVYGLSRAASTAQESAYMQCYEWLKTALEIGK